MSDFKELATNLLKVSAEFKEEFSIPETKLNTLKIASLTMIPDSLAKLTFQTMKLPMNQILSSILLGAEIPGFLIGERIFEEAIEQLDKSPQHNYTIKDLSRITGLEDWKIRRIINSDKLKAESKFDAGTNPGRSGYSISKENMIEFMRNYKQEILACVDIGKVLSNKIFQIKPYLNSFIDDFLEQVNPIIKLGELEQELAEVTKDKKEELTIKVLLQKLEIEKNFVEELQKKLQEHNKNFLNVLKTQNQTVESSTEQNTETKS